MLNSLTLVPQNVTIFVNRVVAHVISKDLIPMIGILIKREDTQTKGRK